MISIGLFLAGTFLLLYHPIVFVTIHLAVLLALQSFVKP